MHPFQNRENSRLAGTILNLGPFHLLFTWDAMQPGWDFCGAKLEAILVPALKDDHLHLQCAHINLNFLFTWDKYSQCTYIHK